MGRQLREGVGTVWVRNQDGVADEASGLNMVPFAEGEDIPKWAADQMGDHCFDKGSKSDNSGGGSDDPKPITEMNAKELKAEIASRNEGRAEEGLIVPDGKKNADLLAALQADDAASAGADNA